MNKKMWRLSLGLLFTLFTSLYANAGVQNYLMWQLPSTGISFPVYVYSAGTQVGFIPSNTLQVFIGPYVPPATSKSGKSLGTSGNYTLYYQNGSTWYSCSLVLQNGGVATSTTCTGAVINSPASQNGAQSNVYTTAMAAIAWPTAASAPSNPVQTSYSNRTISFQNNTQYPMIQIGESCNVANATNSAPSCQNTAIVATITRGTPYVVSVGVQGLNSSAFYMSSFCTAKTVAACGTPPTVTQCSSAPNPPSPPTGWVCTGGYFAGQNAYATKIEPTILAVNGGVPVGASNVDVSAVDGYSVGVKFYPASPAYCTFTVPPENSNVLGAGFYSKATPLAQITAGSTSSLQNMCLASSQLPIPVSRKSGRAWKLSIMAGNYFAGCMSPCTYATSNLGKNGITQDDVNTFCCQGNKNTPATCDVGPTKMGANTSTYNTNIQNSSRFQNNFQNVYGFAYGDAGSDYACPPETNFVVEFTSVNK
ncbi:MAG: hypothetical protein K2P84_06745 [Undibacterium sp.]|nr:hypothetical protein [Undibacterium sp.]